VIFPTVIAFKVSFFGLFALHYTVLPSTFEASGIFVAVRFSMSPALPVFTLGQQFRFSVWGNLDSYSSNISDFVYFIYVLSSIERQHKYWQWRFGFPFQYFYCIDNFVSSLAKILHCLFWSARFINPLNHDPYWPSLFILIR
jgi:hypothetical protein